MNTISKISFSSIPQIEKKNTNNEVSGKHETCRESKSAAFDNAAANYNKISFQSKHNNIIKMNGNSIQISGNGGNVVISNNGDDVFINNSFTVKNVGNNVIVGGTSSCNNIVVCDGSLSVNNGCVDTDAKKMPKGILTDYYIRQNNTEAEIGKNENGFSLYSKYSLVRTNAKKYEGAIQAQNYIKQDNPEAKIGKTDDYSLYSIDSYVCTNAKEIESSVYAKGTLDQDNPEAKIGKDKHGSSLCSAEGNIFTNAKEVEGDIYADENIYITGKGDFKGKIEAGGTVYLIEAKDPSKYNIVSPKVVCLTQEDYNNRRY